MTKRDIVTLYGLFERNKAKGNIKFKYAIIKNNNKITKEIETLRTIEESVFKIKKPYEEKITEYIQEHGVHEDNGRIYIDENNDDDVKAFEDFVNNTSEENKDLIEKFKSEMEKYQNLLNEEINDEFQFHKIDINDCPDDLEAKDLEMLMNFSIID
jgi:DNA-directed RNA polymerase subunit L